MLLKTNICAIAVMALSLCGCYTAAWVAQTAPGDIHEILSRQYRPVDFLVVDAETQHPIEHASVTIRYTNDHLRVPSSHATTDAQGRAQINVARERDAEAIADADGYLRARSFQVESRTVLSLYKQPRPIAGLSFPPGFRGAVRVKERQNSDPTSASAAAPGQREFYTPVVPDGITVVRAPPIGSLQDRDDARVWAAQFDDGTLLRYQNPVATLPVAGEPAYLLSPIRDRVEARSDGVALYHLGSQTDCRSLETLHIYFVGTESQAAVEQQRLARGAASMSTDRLLPRDGYLFRAAPLCTDGMETSTKAWPR